MFKRETDLFLGYIRLRQIPKGAGNEEVSRFFLCLFGKRNKLIHQVITIKI